MEKYRRVVSSHMIAEQGLGAVVVDGKLKRIAYIWRELLMKNWLRATGRLQEGLSMFSVCPFIMLPPQRRMLESVGPAGH